MTSVFLSYDREDAASVVRVARALQRSGHSVWWDREIRPGRRFTEEIERALADAEVVMVLWSSRSVESDWVRDEAAAGRDSGRLVPATLDGAKPPLGFRQFQTIDLSEWLALPDGSLPGKLEDVLTTRAAQAEGLHGCAKVGLGRQRIAFTHTTNGVTIAYSVLGTGPPLVKAGNGYNHLEHELENPLWRHWIYLLSDQNTLVRYDQRGTGMSDRTISNLSFELLVEDLAAVVDATRLERFDLVGISQGSPVAVAFSARYPERVRKLVLINGFATGWRYSADRDIVDSWEALSVLSKSGRKTPGLERLFASQYFPNATRAQADWWNKIQAQSTSPDMAYRFFNLLGSIDVRAQLVEVRAPTLVMHSKDDQVVPFEAGRFLASQIPDAEFVALEGSNHLPQCTDVSWPEVQNELRRFLG